MSAGFLEHNDLYIMFQQTRKLHMYIVYIPGSVSIDTV